MCNGAAEDEPPRLDPCNLVDFGPGERLDKLVDRAAKRPRIGEKRRHVAKHDPGLWIVGNGSYRLAQIHRQSPRAKKEEAGPTAQTRTAENKAASAAEIGAFGLALDDIDETVRPGDDFYAYVNGDWLKSYVIPDEYSSYGSFTVLAERSEERLKEIVESLGGARDETSRKVRDFHSSFIDVDAINAKGLAPLEADFAAIDAIATHEDLAAKFFDPAFPARTPIAAWIGADAKDPNRYTVYLTQSGLGMPNRDYYLEAKFADKKAKYAAYIEQVLTLAGATDAQAMAGRILALETALAGVHWEPAKRRNRDLTYNLKTIDDLQSFAPEAPWRTMLAAAGLDSVAKVVVREDEAIRGIAAIVASTPLDVWKEYLKFHLINTNAAVLPTAFDEANFAFFGTELRGTPKQKERWKRAMAAIDDALGEAVGKLYVEKHFPEICAPHSMRASTRLTGWETKPRPPRMTSSASSRPRSAIRTSGAIIPRSRSAPTTPMAISAAPPPLSGPGTSPDSTSRSIAPNGA